MQKSPKFYSFIQNCVLPPMQTLPFSTHTETKKLPFKAPTYQKITFSRTPYQNIDGRGIKIKFASEQIFSGFATFYIYFESHRKIYANYSTCKRLYLETYIYNKFLFSRLYYQIENIYYSLCITLLMMG